MNFSIEPLEPYRFRLPDETSSHLALPYEPYRWPQLGRYAFQGSFSIQEPWEGHKDKKWYADSRKPYDTLQALLSPHHDKWVEADCLAALVPDETGQSFSVLVNGAMLAETMNESQALRRRMLLLQMPIRTTLCEARVFGGGEISFGEKRGYGIAFDMKPFSR